MASRGYIGLKWRPRPQLWEKTLKVALQRPLLGYGYGSFHKEVIKTDAISLGNLEITRAHNDYLHTSQEIGFPIVVVAVMFFIGLFRRFWAVRHKDRLLICLAVSVFIVLINAGGQTVLRYASIAGTAIVLIAFLAIKLEEIENASRSV